MIKKKISGEEFLADVFIRVDGTHNTRSAMDNFLRRGMKPIAGHNLDKRHEDVDTWVKTVTGAFIDHRLHDTVMDEKIKEAKKARLKDGE